MPHRQKGGYNFMNTAFTEKHMKTMRLMVRIGAVATVVTLIMRVLLMPLLRDSETGRFVTSWIVVAFMLAVLVLLAVMSLSLRQKPPLVGKQGAMTLSVSTIAAGAILFLATLWDAWRLLSMGLQPPPVTAVTSLVGTVTLWLTLLCGLLGGVALIYWGLQLSSEGATRRGMGSVAMLAPVLWMWFRLARYEMSYASAVGLSETFYDFMLFVFMLLFLYKMARFVVGVGVPTMGTLLFLSLATAMFALSGTLTRLCMYLAGDSEAYLASQLAGWPDFALGVLALVFAGVLVAMVEPVYEEEDDSDEEDAGPVNTELISPDEEDEDSQL